MMKHRILLVALVTMAGVTAACSSGAEETTAPSTTTPAAETPTSAEAPAVAAPIVIQADIVSGPKNIPAENRGTAVCVSQSRFPRNSEVVWRARVIDTVTGEQLGEGELESVVAVLGDGQTFDMRFGDHPNDNPTDRFWTAAWDIPEDYATGSVSYEIVATSVDGATTTFAPFQVAPSLLTVTDEVLTTIQEEA